jgi:hypothetical protein
MEDVGQLMLRYIMRILWLGMGLVSTHSDTFMVLASREKFGQKRMRYILSTFVTSLARDGFVQHKLRYKLCPRSHGSGLVKAC